jgi:hypothetical protein
MTGDRGSAWSLSPAEAGETLDHGRSRCSGFAAALRVTTLQSRSTPGGGSRHLRGVGGSCSYDINAQPP